MPVTNVPHVTIPRFSSEYNACHPLVPSITHVIPFQFTQPWDNIIAKALAKVSDVFRDKSEEICRQNYEVSLRAGRDFTRAESGRKTITT